MDAGHIGVLEGIHGNEALVVKRHAGVGQADALDIRITTQRPQQLVETVRAAAILERQRVATIAARCASESRSVMTFDAVMRHRVAQRVGNLVVKLPQHAGATGEQADPRTQ